MTATMTTVASLLSVVVDDEVTVVTEVVLVSVFVFDVVDVEDVEEDPLVVLPDDDEEADPGHESIIPTHVLPQHVPVALQHVPPQHCCVEVQGYSPASEQHCVVAETQALLQHFSVMEQPVHAAAVSRAISVAISNAGRSHDTNLLSIPVPALHVHEGKEGGRKLCALPSELSRPRSERVEWWNVDSYEYLWIWYDIFC